MKFLVIGYGSIGQRQADNLLTLGHEVILLRHEKKNPNSQALKEYYDFESILEQETIAGALICSPTSEHLKQIEVLLAHQIPFLLEKPPTADLSSTQKLAELLAQNGFNHYDMAFNLRHYPPLQEIKNFLPNLGQCYAAKIYASYYLPYWRNNVDYRQTSSAKQELGGGVHLELVHEIDYILWFWGIPQKVVSYLNQISTLEISSPDICVAFFQYPNGFLVELHLDYLSHKYLRGCQIIAENGTLEWEMNQKQISYYERGKQAAEIIFELAPHYDFNETYLKELNHFVEVIEHQQESKVNIQEAIKVMKVLEAIKRSSEKQQWIALNEL